MKNSELKDGMILFVDGVEKFVVMPYGKLFNIQLGKIVIAGLSDIDDNLTYNMGCKIDKISYMGEIIWERKEYVTFDEARKSGKLFKHKDWFTRFYNVKGVFDVLSRDCYKYPPNKINIMLDSKEWEIEK